MIQRIQSLYMLASTILGVVCLSLPLGKFFNEFGEQVSTLYNLWLHTCDKDAYSFAPWALFALLLLVTVLTFLNIFLFRQRALQMRILVFCIILIVGYYAWLAVFAFVSNGTLSFKPSVTAALPFVCIVLDYLAFRGILKDEMLIRSLDRLR